MMVKPVQVAVVTGTIPPGAMKHGGAVAVMRVIVAVFGCERAALVIRQRIACSSYNQKSMVKTFS